MAGYMMKKLLTPLCASTILSSRKHTATMSVVDP